MCMECVHGVTMAGAVVAVSYPLWKNKIVNVIKKICKCNDKGCDCDCSNDCSCDCDCDVEKV